MIPIGTLCLIVPPAGEEYVGRTCTVISYDVPEIIRVMNVRDIKYIVRIPGEEDCYSAEPPLLPIPPIEDQVNESSNLSLELR
jgi:hypothetical protein